MFYSHQLLARKVPLGQIWMAATMHAKMNRRKLDQINIIKICEEILNPSVPMALRLSGILMGGVAIVYERKVKLLYDDVNRLLIEINEAWKVKPAVDPTILPKGKTQAKFAAVTLPENQGTDIGEIEHLVDFSNKHPTIEFQQTAYFAMRLDNLDGLNENFTEEDLAQDRHQVDTANITLFDHYDSHQEDTGPYDRFERFDIAEDEETQFNVPPQNHPEIPTTLVPSPPSRGGSKANDVLDQHLGHLLNQPSDEFREVKQDLGKQRITKKKRRRPRLFMMDDEQTIIPGNLYQSWLQDSSDIMLRRGKNRKHASIATSTMKITQLMELPPVVLSYELLDNGGREIYYPAPLMEMWMRNVVASHSSPSGRNTLPIPPGASTLSPPPSGQHHNHLLKFDFGDLHSGIGSQSSVEKQRVQDEVRIHLPEIIFMPNQIGENESNLRATPTSSGYDVRSIPSSGSGHGLFSTSTDANSARSLKKRHYSSSRHSGGGLEPLDEETQWALQTEPNFMIIEEQREQISKLTRPSQKGPTPDQELLVETGPTQAHHHVVDEELENRTNIIRRHLKAYFETPGAPQAESLNQLSYGMNKKRAAQLFYQTCVLATRDFLKVKQKVPYGDIFISRGPTM
ncbi:hypothetical protein Nepgr_006024 [Nepenthes gracilis]|uniref:Sister chromatid cohesion 1 protein 1 n=1 Tax=Nepenthes gracilis TaxID=150966 RepID=A0AAD3XH06_NEPGR|nr:hypothetical protein Nepgr_006024 [Nepenthes gracilis]